MSAFILILVALTFSFTHAMGTNSSIRQPHICDSSDDFCVYVTGIPGNEGRYIQHSDSSEINIDCLKNNDPIVESQNGEITDVGEIKIALAICNDSNGNNCTPLPNAITKVSQNINQKNNVYFTASPKMININLSDIAGKYKGCNPNEALTGP